MSQPKHPKKALRYLTLGLLMASFSACQTAPARSAYPAGSANNQAHWGTADASRSLAAAGSSVISQFLDELASRRSLDRDALDEAFLKMANGRDPNIESWDDIQRMKDQDQKQLISELLANPDFEKNFGVKIDVAKQAQLDAINYSDVHGIKTTDVPGLKETEVPTNDTSSPIFLAKYVTSNPAARVDVQEMLNENEEIRAETGISVLNTAKPCDKITTEEAVDDLALVVDGVDHDVKTGVVKTAQDLPSDVEKQVSWVTGASKEDSHARVRGLSDPNGDCGALTPAIGGF